MAIDDRLVRPDVQQFTNMNVGWLVVSLYTFCYDLGTRWCKLMRRTPAIERQRRTGIAEEIRV